MIIQTLAENTSISEGLKCEHGLSLFVETKNHKLLFDTGASELFAENALKMDIDLSDVDIAVLSHGHYDHGGGIKTFMNLNKKSKIYINKRAFDKHYSNRPNAMKKDIGLDETLLPSNRFIFTGDYLLKTNAKYYTCHCTGLGSYTKLKNMMGEKVDYLSTGSRIII